MQLKHKAKSKILCVLLTLAMVFTMLPLTAAAENDTPPTDAVVIAAFDTLDETTLYQGYDFDTVTLADLDLPDTLTGTDADGDPVTISGVTWESAPDFDPAIEAAYPGYIFTPALPEGYILADGVSAPVITVFIRPEGGVQVQPLAGFYDYEIDLSGTLDTTNSDDSDGYNIGSNTITLNQSNKTYCVTGTTTTYAIHVYAANITLTLDGASVTTNENYPLTLNKPTTLTLLDNNILNGGILCYNEDLTINGTGSLITDYILGGTNTTTINSGTVSVKSIEAGTLNISGGTVNVNGSSSGSGVLSAATINISGGTVSAENTESWSNAVGYITTFTITGGSVYLTGGEGATLTQPKNGSGTTLYMTTLSGLPTNAAVTDMTAPSGYGINDMHADSAGKLYLWLPSGNQTVSLTANGDVYSGAVDVTANNQAPATLTTGGGAGPIAPETIIYPGTALQNDPFNSSDQTLMPISSTSGNSVTVNSDTISGAVFGGFDKDGSADAGGNTVIINGGTITGNGNGAAISGGRANNGAASNNTITINGGTITGFNNVRGGESMGGDAKNNHIIITGGTIMAQIESGVSSGTVDNNSISIREGGALDLSASELRGFGSGSALNVERAGVTVKQISGFNQCNFKLPASTTNGGVMLTATNSASVEGATIGITFAGTPAFSVGDKITLITNTSGTPANSTATVSGYTFGIAVENGELVATVTAVPGGGTTYTATLTVNKDGGAYTGHNKTFTLRQSGTTKYTGSGADGTVTFSSVANGVYNVFDGTVDTGATININNAAGGATLNYYTVTFSVADAGTASGSTISAYYNGGSISTGAVVLGGGSAYLDFLVTGKGATTYVYAWSGSFAGTTTMSCGVFGLYNAINTTCTVTGTGSAPTAIAVKAQPTKLVYDEGDFLDLFGLEVTLTVGGSPVDVAYDNSFLPGNFAQYGIAAELTGGYANPMGLLTAADSGKTVTLTCNGLTAQTAPITVKSSGGQGGGGGGGGGSVTPPTIPAGDGGVKVDYTQSGGNATLTLPEAKITEIIDKAEDDTVIFDLSGVKNTTTATLPAQALTKLADAGLDIELKLPQGTITLDADAAKNIAAQAGGTNLSVALNAVNQSALTAAQREAINPGDLVFNITAMSGTQAITNFDGTITVTVPYDGLLPVAVWYLNSAGELEKLDCVYNPATKTVTFTTNHLSLYVVGQDTAWVSSFIDVKESAWYYGDVAFACQNGLMTGTAADRFSPDTPLTRAMLVTILYRAAGSPEVEPMYAAHMMDVEDGSWYADAMGWAVKNGIISGYGEGLYGPEDNITREQFAAILYCYAGSPALAAGQLEFADAEKVADWAFDAFVWATGEGIITGKPGNLLDPKGTATRAEAAAMLHRFLEEVE